MLPLGAAFIQETTIFREFGPLSGSTMWLAVGASLIAALAVLTLREVPLRSTQRGEAPVAAEGASPAVAAPEGSVPAATSAATPSSDETGKRPPNKTGVPATEQSGS